MSTERYDKVFAKRKATSEKRKGQTCHVYTLKIQENKLNLKQKEYLNRVFLEAKWFYNFILSSDDIYKFNTTIKEVQVLNKERESETREINVLCSQSKQSIYDRTKTSIKSLSTKKKRGRPKEVGKLKFKSEVNSIPFKQRGNSWDIRSNKIRLSGCKSLFKVSGLNQLDNLELANCILFKDSTGYYIKVTAWKNIEFKNPKEVVGIDFGIKDDLVLSNGLKLKTKFHIPLSLKRCNRRLSKKVKGSKNYAKQKTKLNKRYKKLTNQKLDCKHKIVSYLKNNYCHIGIQNENVKGWHAGLFGRQIQQSIIGGIISELKQLQQTSMIDRFFPSTQLCPQCGCLNKHTLDQRVYNCDCGYTKDRDVHAAHNILVESLNIKQIPMEHRKFTPLEFNTTALLSIGKWVSMNIEGGRYNSLELC